MDEQIKKFLLECNGFEWDQGNILKNWQKHGVSTEECELIFFNEPLVVATDEKHSQNETRFFCLGKTDMGRKIFAVFTIRNSKIRIISARDMSSKERKEYLEYEKRTNSKI